MSKSVLEQNYAIRKVKELKLHPMNARKGDVGAIGESMDRFGFFGAVIVQKSTGYILVGNHRYKVAVKKGIKEIPAFTVDIGDAEALEILAIDNRSTDNAKNDPTKLAAALARLRELSGTIEGTGYGEADLKSMVEDAAKEAEEVAATGPKPSARMPQTTLPVLAFGRRSLPMTKEEADMFEAMLDGYVEQHGTAVGFATAFIQAAEVGIGGQLEQWEKTAAQKETAHE